MACIILYVGNCLYRSMMMKEYEYCLDTCSLYVSGDTYIREKKFGWMEMGIVVQIHVPIQGVKKYSNKPNGVMIAVFGMSSVATGIW